MGGFGFHMYRDARDGLRLPVTQEILAARRRAGVLETLVVASSDRGTGAGRALLDAARERLAEWGARVMTISVIAGNEGALRFYRREGAGDYLHTLIMPVRQPLPP
jgi:GNAT superfamily N-acetyltransferase